jgi:hypothetical protein
MKTPMQIAIERYKNDGVSFTDWFMDNYEMLLEEEKHHIQMAFNDGRVTGAFKRIKNSDDYYNQTYNQNK